LSLIREALHRDDRAEYLVLDHLVVLVQAGHDGRLEHVAPLADVMTAGAHLGVRRRALDEATDAGQLVGIVERPEVGVLDIGAARLGPLARSTSSETKSLYTAGPASTRVAAVQSCPALK